MFPKTRNPFDVAQNVTRRPQNISWRTGTKAGNLEAVFFGVCCNSTAVPLTLRQRVRCLSTQQFLIAAKSSVKLSVGSVTCNRVWGKPGVCMKEQPSEVQWRKEPPSTLVSLKMAPTLSERCKILQKDVTRGTRSGRRQVEPTYMHKGCEVCAFKGCGSRKRSSRTSRKSSKAGQLVIDMPSGR